MKGRSLSTKTKNIVSIMLPLTSIFIIALLIKSQPTGLAVYENKTLYRLNGTIGISLEEGMPSDAYIIVKVNKEATKIRIIDFLKVSGGEYIIKDNVVFGNDVYKADFTSLGIIPVLGKGSNTITTEIVHKDKVIYSHERVINV